MERFFWGDVFFLGGPMFLRIESHGVGWFDDFLICGIIASAYPRADPTSY